MTVLLCYSCMLLAGLRAFFLSVCCLRSHASRRQGFSNIKAHAYQIQAKRGPVHEKIQRPCDSRVNAAQCAKRQDT